MKKLSLTNSEFNHLRDIYLSELDKALKRVEHLTAILKKIDTDFDPPKEDELVEQYQQIKKAKPAVKESSAPKRKVSTKRVAKNKTSKKTRKPIVNKGSGKNKVKWNDFVINTIKERNAPILSSELSEIALKHFDVSEADVPKVKRVISGALSKLVTMENKLIAQKLPDSRVKKYGLVEWFDAKGNLKPEFSGN